MYSIYAGDVCFHDDVFTLGSAKAINPKLILEDNSAGSLTMTLPPQNPAYSTISRMTTDIFVRKEGKEIWSGRVLSESEDFYRNRTLTCEGALAFFNDSIQPPAKHPGMSVRGYLAKLIEVHNSQVGSNRQFAIGAVTVEDTDFPDRYTNHESTMSLVNALIEQYGGHIRVRRENGIRYVDYWQDYPNTCRQAIQFGSNLIDFTKQWDFTDFATVIVPLGCRLDKSTIEGLEARLTVESVNAGSMYIQSEEAVKAFGLIAKTVTWDDVSDANVLLEKARDYLTDLQFDNLELELSALDLHYLDANVDAVELLDKIQVISRPHGLNREFPVTRLEIPLDNPEQTQFKLGDTVKTSLSGASSQINAAFQQEIEKLPGFILEKAKDNAIQIMNQATTGFITITKNEHGSDTLYISNIQDYTRTEKLWRWNMDGLGFVTQKPKDAEGKEYVIDKVLAAITMDGAIVADRITAGTLSGDRVRTGVIKDNNDNVIFDLTNGKLTIKKGSIQLGEYTEGHFDFEVDENGNVYARKGTFAGSITGASGVFGGTVQAVDYLDSNGQSMLTNGKFSSQYLSLYGLTIKKLDAYGNDTGVISFAVSTTGDITINSNITINGDWTIDWKTVGERNVTFSSVYRQAKADIDNLDIPVLPDYIKNTKITSTTIESPTITGNIFYGSEFNVVSEEYGSFNLYGYINRRYMHVLEIVNGDVYVTIRSPCGATIRFEGDIDFSNANVRGL